MRNWLMKKWPKTFRGDEVERVDGYHNTLLLRFESGYCCLIDKNLKEHDLVAEIEMTLYRWKILASINGAKSETPPMYKAQALAYAEDKVGRVIFCDDNLKTIFVRGTGQMADPSR